MIDPFVAHFLRAVPVDDMMTHLTALTELDRYQASSGLDEAAVLTAEAALAAGLREVDIRRYRADGTPQWWTFASPAAWTPSRATLRLAEPDGSVLHLDHAELPFLVAAYSAPTPRVGVAAPLVPFRPGVVTPALVGALALVDRVDYRYGALLAELTAAGALGFLTDAPARADGDDLDRLDRRGRVELPPGSALCAFSLTPPEFQTARRMADRGRPAQVHIDIDRGATMPVVSALLPGDGLDEEIWIIAHLCHPRPSANDNASGVAAALGVGAALAAARRADAGWGCGRSIRFLFGPEFVGTAAALHDRRDGGILPQAVINLDMVGEDQAACTAPFIVERPPDTQPSLLVPLAEYVVGETFAATSSAGGSWGTAPFQGFSDHALFGDPSVGLPAVQFCHPDDRFNHSAADTVDKVSRAELNRSAAAAATLAYLCARPATPGPDIRQIVDRWCGAEEASQAKIGLGYDEAWARGLAAHVRRTIVAVQALADPDGAAVDADAAPMAPDGSLRRNWPGPLNLRAMQAALSPEQRAELAGLIAREKGTLSMLFNLAIRADGGRDADGMIRDTSFGLRRPIDHDVGHRLVDLLLESRWTIPV
jgi:hypothetical protein